jgi:hypothetical protein
MGKSEVVVGHPPDVKADLLQLLAQLACRVSSPVRTSF